MVNVANQRINNNPKGTKREPDSAVLAGVLKTEAGGGDSPGMSAWKLSTGKEGPCRRNGDNECHGEAWTAMEGCVQ